MLTIQGASESAYEDWQKALAACPQCPHLLLPASHSFRPQGFCSIHGNVVVRLPSFAHQLSMEVTQRGLKDSFYAEEEVWYAMLVLLETAASFRRAGLRLEQISTANMLLNQAGQLKVISQFTAPVRQSSPDDDWLPLLAPELLDALESRALVSDSVSDTYELGLVLLEMCSLLPARETQRRGGIRPERIEARLQMGQELFSRQLTELLRVMLQPHPGARPDVQSLLAVLQPFQSTILSLQPLQLQPHLCQQALLQHPS